eukprot:Polyplicarium_translucidae@DN1308_c0_g1_i1.p1
MNPERFVTAVLVVLLLIVTARLAFGDFAPKTHDFHGPCTSELWICVPVAAVIAVVSGILRRWAIGPVVDKMLSSGPHGAKPSALIRRKMCDSLFNAIYFALVTTFAFVALRNKPWFPRELGGAETENYWSGYATLQESSAVQRWYFFLNGGYRLHLGLSLFFSPRLPDFRDNLVQAVMALTLIFLSFGSNYLRVGAVLMLLHDICDILIALVKFTTEAGWAGLSLANAAAVVILWSYLRLYCFLKIVLVPIYHFARRENFEVGGWPWVGFVLLCLVLMNFYWFTLLLKSIFVFLRSGRMTDFHSRIPETDSQKKSQISKDRRQGKKET